MAAKFTLTLQTRMPGRAFLSLCPYTVVLSFSSQGPLWMKTLCVRKGGHFYFPTQTPPLSSAFISFERVTATEPSDFIIRFGLG